jgi:2-oxoglutarate/2-oxoacid ferredoxin oxidoreductase subunit beta
MVWVITGDGDALSIGGNHVLHSMRRNVDIKLVMFNNRIYGLTKGQASPTSELGKKTKSTPAGTVDFPVQPLSIALAAEASFVARSVDTHTEHLQETLERAGHHRGSAFVEVLQNCNIFNDGAFRDFTERDVREDRMLVLEHGKPMVFGKERDKGIRLRGLHPEVVALGNGVTEADLLVHDERPRIRTSPTCCRACGGPSSRCRSACCAAWTGQPTTSWSAGRSTRPARSRARATWPSCSSSGETWVVE